MVSGYEIMVGRKLRETRLCAGMTQAGLAQALGISAQQVQKYETGRNRITVGRLMEMAVVLEVTPHQLLNLPETPMNYAAAHEETMPRVWQTASSPAESPLTLELFQAFHGLPSAEHRACVVQVARLMRDTHTY